MLYAEGIRQIWKLYYENQFRRESFTITRVLAVYRAAIHYRIMMDRVQIFWAERREYRTSNKTCFEEVGRRSVDTILNNWTQCLGIGIA